jgi:hypothetical protein
LAVALVNVGIVAGAAVWVGAITIALDLACGLVFTLEEDGKAYGKVRLTEQL